jgi:NAD(P)-dependent dehydrogenase (short-subunit alcohol dehydrogenase family)
VAVAGHIADKAALCAGALTAQGGDAFAATFDSVSVPETRRMVDEVTAHFGRLDILVNCVGLHREEKAEDAGGRAVLQRADRADSAGTHRGTRRRVARGAVSDQISSLDRRCTSTAGLRRLSRQLPA